MKRLVLLAFFAVMSAGFFAPACAFAGNPTSETQNANKRQLKALKKYSKAQIKAQRKMIKTDRKNTHYPATGF